MCTSTEPVGTGIGAVCVNRGRPTWPMLTHTNTHTTCVASPTKKRSRFCGQIHDWKHLYLRFFLRAMFRSSPKTPASPLIRKSTTLRSTLWCSHYSVAKRQQFSCPLRRHPDFAGEFGQRGSRSLDLFFLVP